MQTNDLICKDNQLTDLHKALDKFRAAFNELVNASNELENNYSLPLQNLYPFTKSLEDTFYDAQAWVNQSQEDIGAAMECKGFIVVRQVMGSFQPVLAKLSPVVAFFYKEEHASEDIDLLDVDETDSFGDNLHVIPVTVTGDKFECEVDEVEYCGILTSYKLTEKQYPNEENVEEKYFRNM